MCAMVEENSGTCEPRDLKDSLRTSVAVLVQKVTSGGKHRLSKSVAVLVQKVTAGGKHRLSKSVAVLVQKVTAGSKHRLSKSVAVLVQKVTAGGKLGLNAAGTTAGPKDGGIGTGLAHREGSIFRAGGVTGIGRTTGIYGNGATAACGGVVFTAASGTSSAFRSGPFIPSYRMTRTTVSLFGKHSNTTGPERPPFGNQAGDMSNLPRLEPSQGGSGDVSGIAATFSGSLFDTRA